MSDPQLSERERRVLEAVIRAYVETAEPAGSRMISRRSGLGVSAATIRNTMSDLEDKGFLFHPHTSAGRVPSERLLLVLRLMAGAAHTSFVEAPVALADTVLAAVTMVLNERLSGLTL